MKTAFTISRSTFRLFILTACLSLFSPIHSALAQVLVSESFQSPTDGLPTNWGVRHDGSAGSTGIQNWVADISGAPAYGLKMTREGGLYRSNVYYSGSTAFTDYQGSVNLTLSGAGMGGALLRLGNPGRNATEGYFVAVDAVDSTHRLVISKDPISHTNPGTVLAEVALDSSINNKFLRLDFSIIGNTTTGDLYIWEEGTASWSEQPIASITATDNTYTVGGVGLRGTLSANDRHTQFANFEISVAPIPEPKTYALAIAILGGLTILYRRRKHRSSQ